MTLFCAERWTDTGSPACALATALRKCQMMLGTKLTLHSCGNATGAGENGEMMNRWTKSERYFVNVTQFIYGKVCQVRKIVREWTKFPFIIVWVR